MARDFPEVPWRRIDRRSWASRFLIVEGAATGVLAEAGGIAALLRW
jgi:hypothetical protein